jgi:large subunit ribosomal protein L4
MERGIMKVDVIDMHGKKIKEVELPAGIFDSKINIDLMHQAYVRQISNAHLGTHDTKTRGEVSGGGKKPWAQKGTGRARQGSTRAPQWVHGGKAHTPHPHSYDQRMPLKMRRAALRSALSVRASESAIVVVDEFKVKDHKSGPLAETMIKLVGNSSALLVLPNKEGRDSILVASRNNPMIKVLLAGYLNIRDILSFDRLVMDLSALKAIESHLAVTEKK